MINLLPPEMKSNILYARRNSDLLRWSIAMFIGLVGIVVILAFGQIYISQTTKSYAADAEKAREQLQIQKLSETQKRVNDITSSLKLLVQVLSRQVVFSKVVKQVGFAIPPGATLTDLQIAKLQGGIDLKFKATDYDTATQIQVNLEDPNNKIFDKADLISISCIPVTSTTPRDTARYPCSVAIRALFAKNNPYLFINQGAN